MESYRHCWSACAAMVLAFGAAPALAQGADPAPSADAAPDAAVAAADTVATTDDRDAALPRDRHHRDIYAGDYLIIGVGAALLPAYEGSHKHHVIPAFGVGGRFHGVGISPRSAGVALNFVPPRRHSRVGFSLGPVIRYRGSRTIAISDPTPVRVGTGGKGLLELGVNGSVSLKHVLSRYDSLSLGTDVRWDATRGTGGRVIAPGINYFTPVSKGQVVGISASADFINGALARQNYMVTQSGGGPMPGVAPPHGGLRAIGGRIFTAYDLDHDLRNGGFSVLFAVGYSRLVGIAASSPLVRSNGTHDQVVLATGLAFAF